MSKLDYGKHALVGHTGFVGSNLKKQHQFHSLYRSSDIQTIYDQEFDLLVCAGAQAKKWMANKDPYKDRINIRKLIDALSHIRCENFILISTVDVFSTPRGVNELSIVKMDDLHPYGLHRRELELFVENRFKNSLILRLPGLVGPGLKKNIIYDIHNNKNMAKIDSRSIFQFYPIVNLWSDMQIAIELEKKIVHLTAEPILVSEVSEKAFGIPFCNEIDDCYSLYDCQSIFANRMGGNRLYTYSKRESLQAIRYYAQTEPMNNP